MSELIAGFLQGVTRRDEVCRRLRGIKGFQGSAARSLEGAASVARCALATLSLVALMALVVMLSVAPPSAAQTELAGVSGRVTDPSGAVIADAEVEIKNTDTGISTTARTNQDGLYTIPSLHPGQYLINVRKAGFKSVTVTELTLNVQDNVVRNFALQLGSVSETVTITGDQVNINTTDASVSTVVDRQFAENLPLNGRSFQTLLYLTPGVTLNSPSAVQSGYASGQFVVNGQRASSNYWMVDGVSANIGITPGPTPGGGASGALGSFNVLGGTSSLVSVDALQEFRIQTSTYAPEFGRTPGGQISIATRAGTSQFHGSAFDYFRNSVLDSADWFSNANELPKAEERQNDFGGTFAGPVIKDKVFFFFSYEGLRLRLPQTALTTVPDLVARQNAIPAMQPLLNAFPLPNPGKPDIAPGVAPFDASFSNPATLDAYSIRYDQAVAKSLNLFGRYNYSPSNFAQRGSQSLNTISTAAITVHTVTVGATWTGSSQMANDLRFNYSSSGGSQVLSMDTFGGGNISSLASFLPSPFSLKDSISFIQILGGRNMRFGTGKNSANFGHQYNIVDTLSIQKGSHSLKFGVDYRRVSTHYDPRLYTQNVTFRNLAAAEAGNVFFALAGSGADTTLLFRNLGLFAQDTWRVVPRLTFTYGLRWDMDFAPSSERGPGPVPVTGFDLNDLSALALGAVGNAIYNTRYGNFAPRIGASYQLSQNPSWALVLRSGFGVFYDLASSEVGNRLTGNYPFTATSVHFNPGIFPLPASDVAAPPIVPPSAANGQTLIAFDPHMQLPYTLQWNVALEQALGKSQSLTASYVGSAGRRLLATEDIAPPNANYADANIISNGGTSTYNALQIQFQRRLSRGLQALCSYTWSHSIDDGSYGAYTNGTIAHLSANRGDSDFDVRNTLALALTYDISVPKTNAVTDAILRGWSTENVVQVHSALPVNVLDLLFSQLTEQNSSVEFRPDVVPAQSLYLHGSQYPGGKALNPSAFTDPPVDPITGNPTRQGNLGRNALRAFGLTQWDFAVHRDFPIHESLKLQFRAELFNVLNHPNFAPYNPYFGIGDPFFGQSTQMLGQSLNIGTGNGGFNPLYQIGGPRSVQLALKLQF